MNLGSMRTGCGGHYQHTVHTRNGARAVHTQNGIHTQNGARAEWHAHAEQRANAFRKLARGMAASSGERRPFAQHISWWLRMQGEHPLKAPSNRAQGTLFCAGCCTNFCGTKAHWTDNNRNACKACECLHQLAARTIGTVP